MKLIKTILIGALTLMSFNVMASKSPSSPDAAVYIISPANGEHVTSPLKVVFGLTGMGIAPAGTDKSNTGHHHLLVNGKKLPAMNKAMKKQVMHFGGGQTETTLKLAPGTHTLQLILGDKAHVPHQPPLVSEAVTVIVK